MICRILKIMTPPVVLKVCTITVRNIKRLWVKRKLEGQKRLHLGCGKNILDGWANIDLKSNGDVIGWDLTSRLPVRTGTVELIYCEHFIEHITLKQATALLIDCHRILRSDGILRLSTPSLKKLVDEYLLGKTSEWYDVKWSPATPCQMVNEAFHLWNHKFIYDADELKRIFEEAGFRKVTHVAWQESTTPALMKLECRPFHDELIIEAVK